MGLYRDCEVIAPAALRRRQIRHGKKRLNAVIYDKKTNETLCIAVVRHCHFKKNIEKIAYHRRPVIVAAKSYDIIKIN